MRFAYDYGGRSRVSSLIVRSYRAPQAYQQVQCDSSGIRLPGNLRIEMARVKLRLLDKYEAVYDRHLLADELQRVACVVAFDGKLYYIDIGTTGF